MREDSTRENIPCTAVRMRELTEKRRKKPVENSDLDPNWYHWHLRECQYQIRWAAQRGDSWQYIGSTTKYKIIRIADVGGYYAKIELTDTVWLRLIEPLLKDGFQIRYKESSFLWWFDKKVKIIADWS